MRIVYPISHVASVLSFLSFFVMAFTLGVNCTMDLTFEIIAPLGGSANTQNLYAACVAVLLLCTFFILCFFFSLFWEIIKVVFVKKTAKYKIIKVTLFLLTLLVSTLYTTLTKSSSVGFFHFLNDSLNIAWLAAFALSLGASIGLLIFVYKEECSDVQALPLLPFLAITILFTILSPIAFKVAGASVGAICFAFFYPLFTVALMVYVCFRGCRRPGGEHFVIRKRFALLLAVAYGSVLILAIASRVDCGADCQISYFNGSVSFKPHSAHRAAVYPICDKTWTSLKLDAVDLTFLADLTYKIEQGRMEDLNRTANSYFQTRGLRWNVSFVSLESSSPWFYHLVEETTRVQVIGIRGAQDSARDWFEKMKIWSEVATYQVLSVPLPAQRFSLPFISRFISVASFMERILHHNRLDHYFSAIESYVAGIKTNTAEILLVGHSLGGGIAKIIGARSQVPAVSFSSPGEVYHHRKFGYELSDLQRHTTSIAAHGDLLTWIDKHGGLVQFIDCQSTDFAECHSIRTTYCELKNKCGRTSPVEC